MHLRPAYSFVHSIVYCGRYNHGPVFPSFISMRAANYYISHNHIPINGEGKHPTSKTTAWAEMSLPLFGRVSVWPPFTPPTTRHRGLIKRELRHNTITIQ